GPRFGERFKLGPSTYVNLALTQRFWVLNRPADLTATVFNALAVAGGRAQLTAGQYGRRYDAPRWGKLRLRYRGWGDERPTCSPDAGPARAASSHTEQCSHRGDS